MLSYHNAGLSIAGSSRGRNRTCFSAILYVHFINSVEGNQHRRSRLLPAFQHLNYTIIYITLLKFRKWEIGAGDKAVKCNILDTALHGEIIIIIIVYC